MGLPVLFDQPACLEFWMGVWTGLAAEAAPAKATAAFAGVGATQVAKPATLRRSYRSPSWEVAVLGFVLSAGEAVDHAPRASRLPPLPQQQHQQQLPAFVGATQVAKLVTLQRSYWSPSWEVAVLGFVLMAGEAVDSAPRASRLASLLQKQHQQQLPAFVGATEVAKPVTLQRPYWSPSCCVAVLGFVLIAGEAVDSAPRASRLPPLLQEQQQDQRQLQRQEIRHDGLLPCCSPQNWAYVCETSALWRGLGCPGSAYTPRARGSTLPGRVVVMANACRQGGDHPAGFPVLALMQANDGIGGIPRALRRAPSAGTPLAGKFKPAEFGLTQVAG